MIADLCRLFLILIIGCFVIIPVYFNVYKEQMYYYFKKRQEEEKRSRRKIKN